MQQMIAPINMIVRIPYFCRMNDEIKANKNMADECVDWIHDTFVVEQFNSVIIVPMTTPKLLSIPIVPANVRKAPKQTNHATLESFSMENISFPQ